MERGGSTPLSFFSARLADTSRAPRRSKEKQKKAVPTRRAPMQKPGLRARRREQETMQRKKAVSSRRTPQGDCSTPLSFQLTAPTPRSIEVTDKTPPPPPLSPRTPAPRRKS